MILYCLNCRKNTESKQQDTKGLLSSLELKTPLRQILLLGPLLF